MSDGLYKKLKISSRDIGEVEEYLSESHMPPSLSCHWAHTTTTGSPVISP